MADARLSEALGALDAISRDRSRRGEWSDSLEAFDALACSSALKPEHVQQGWDLALSGRLASQEGASLLPSLLPREPLSPAPILRIVSILGEVSHTKAPFKGKVDYKLQRAALERLSLLLEAGAVSAEGRKSLGKLWGVLARGLDYGTLRDATATVLCQITQRAHVQEYRVKNLRLLLNSLDAPPASCHRLLSIFHSFCPELVPSHIPTKLGGKPLSGKKMEWVARVREHLRDPDEMDSAREAKRRRVGEAFVPSAAVFNASMTSTTLDDLGTLNQVAKRMATLALPSQAGSALNFVPGSSSIAASEADRAKAWAVITASAFGGNKAFVARLDSFVHTQLRHELNELDETSAGQARAGDLLCRVRELSAMSGEALASVERFLATYLLTWDGNAHRAVVFELISQCRPRQYDELYEELLHPLQRLAVSADAAWLADLVECLTQLVRTWSVRDDWAFDADAPHTTWAKLDPDTDYYACLQALLDYTDRLIAASSQTCPESVSLRFAALTFYETCLSLPLECELPVVVLPSPSFAYACLVADEAMTVSRICGVVAKMRPALTDDKSALDRTDPANVALVERLNEFLTDFVNLLWQKRFLHQSPASEGKPTFGLTAEQIEAMQQTMDQREQVLGPALGLTVHPALAPLGKKCLNELEARDGKVESTARGPPVLASTLKELAQSGGVRMSFLDFRVAFLEWLGEKGAKGVGDLLGSSLQSLITRRQSLEAAQAA